MARERRGRGMNRIVPPRRNAEQRPRIAAAQRADDQIVGLRRVLDNNHMLALPAAMAESADRLIGIGQKRGAEIIIRPGLGHDAGTNLWADLV